jgi:predicted metal-dependent enzyme (double-stranded beta helix superfamily)
METNRIISIIISDLSLENLKLQESLEKAINSCDDVNTKLTKVKMYLAELATNEMMLTKFQSLVSPQNNNDLKQNQNG